MTKEELLWGFRRERGCLFHGSWIRIPYGHKLVSPVRGEVFASSDPAIAILKAVFRNNARNLGYPMFIEEDRNNLKLEILGPKSDTIVGHGYVYVIDDASGFVRDPNSNWQYSRRVASQEGVSFSRRIAVTIADFPYLVEVRP
jgi:hypothetical protein